MADEGVSEGNLMRAVKAIGEDDNTLTVGGYLLLWGGPEERDLQGEYFTKATELWMDQYTTVPTLFHHGLYDPVGLSVVGHRTKATADDVGVFVEDVIDKSNKYWTFIDALVKAGRLHYSPGSAPHLVKTAADGELLSFPVIEDTLTHSPAQYRLRPIEEIKASYKSAMIEMPETASETAGAGVSDVEKLRMALEIEKQLLDIVEVKR